LWFHRRGRARPLGPAKRCGFICQVDRQQTVPKKETARITVLPNPPAKPAMEMKKMQPLIDLPAVDVPTTTVTVASKIEPQPISKIDEIPMSLCWGLLGASAAILILQIWNYLS